MEQMNAPDPGVTSLDTLNRIEQELEQRADHEAETGAPEFMEWQHDCLDVTDLSSLTSYVLSKSLEADIFAKRIQAKYREYRVNNAPMDERDDIERQIMEAA